MSLNSQKIKVDLALRFFSENLDFDEIAKLIGVQATESYRKGDFFYAPSGDVRGQRRISGWIYQEEQVTDDIEQSVEAFLGKFANKEKAFKIIEEKVSRRDFFVGIFEESSFHNVTLKPRMSALLSNFSLTFDCSIYSLI